MSITAKAPALTASIEQIGADPTAFRVLTGDRPTGRLHLGHYFGSLRNRVHVQNLGVETLILIADYQVLTDRDLTGELREHVHGLVLDYLAVGIDPNRATIFTHSAIPALNQLLLPFLSLVSVSELDRNPTVREEIIAADRGSVSASMYTYPAHQAADILFCHANVVPVGDDQLPHLELTRTIARRFNARYGELFTPPQALLSDTPRLSGTDGRAKMSKSRGNAIAISATADETARIIKAAITDTQRHITFDPLNRPEVSNLVTMAALCTGQAPQAVAAQVSAMGAAGLKKLVTEAVNDYFAPIRLRRREFAADPAAISAIVAGGNARAEQFAETTLSRVRAAMGTAY